MKRVVFLVIILFLLITSVNAFSIKDTLTSFSIKDFFYNLFHKDVVGINVDNDDLTTESLDTTTPISDISNEPILNINQEIQGSLDESGEIQIINQEPIIVEQTRPLQDYENITIKGEGDRVSFKFKDKAGNLVDTEIFNCFPTGSEHSCLTGINLAKDYDEPLIIEEDTWINVTEIVQTYYPGTPFEYISLDDIEPVFVYYYDGYSYFIQLDDINEEQNTILFKIINTDEEFIGNYSESGGLNNYYLLNYPNPFTLAFNEATKMILIFGINDQQDAISKIETYSGAIITLHDEEDRIILHEEDGRDIGVSLIQDPLPVNIMLDHLISQGNSKFEIHPVEFIPYPLHTIPPTPDLPVRFEGRTDYGTKIKWEDYYDEIYIPGIILQRVTFQYPY